MSSFYKAFMDMRAFWMVFPNSASHILWINSSLSFKAWTFNHLLDSQAMWVLVQCSHAKLWDFIHLNVDSALDFFSPLVSIISLAISCLEMRLESQQQHIHYQGLSGSPDVQKNTWFHETEISLTQSSLFTMNTKPHLLGKEEVDGDYFLPQIFQVFSLSLLAPSQGHTCFSYCFQTLISICFCQSNQFQQKNAQFCTLISLWRQLHPYYSTSAETLPTSGALALRVPVILFWVGAQRLLPFGHNEKQFTYSWLINIFAGSSPVWKM